MILRTLLSHYRRHPIQGLFLLTGIIIANVLLSGTLLINSQARASYQDGEQLLSSGPMGTIEHRGGRRNLDEAEFVRLRRMGFDMLAPVLRKSVMDADGAMLEVLGIDLFSMSSQGSATEVVGSGRSNSGLFTGFAFAPWQLWIAPGRLDQLGWTEGSRPRLAGGQQLPEVTVVEGDQLGHRLLMDLGALQSLTGSTGELSWLAVFPAEESRIDALRKSLPEDLVFVASTDSPDAAEMTSSFHLNLAAMGLLSFVVGLFLIYNALAFSYTDRSDLVRRMRLSGVDRASLRRALMLELLLFLGAGSLLGLWLGAQLAAWLLPGVGQTLAQLYDVYITYPDAIAPSGLLLPLAMTGLAALACVLIPQRELLGAPLLERWQDNWRQRNLVHRDRSLVLAGLAFLLISAGIGALNPGLWLTLGGMACLLLGAAFLLPGFLRLLLTLIQGLIPARQPRLEWLIADSRWLLGPAALALMAMTMALVANSGLNTMISSFRSATDQWLDQRLAADLFLQARNSPSQIQAVLDASRPGLIVSDRYRTRLNPQRPSGEHVQIETVTLPGGENYRNSVTLIEQVADAQSAFENGDGLYISERAWRLDGWQPGDRVQLCAASPPVNVVGVYHDYGNPLSQWMVNRALFRLCWPELEPVSLAIYGPENTDWGQVRETLTSQADIRPDAVINQAELKAVGMAVFDRTFTVTRALNALTLLVAAIGIFCAVSAIHHHRVGQQALLASLGVNRRQRAALLLGQWGLIGGLCLLLVWPFGMLLAGYLARVVTPAAFGWSFGLQIEVTQMAGLLAWALLSLLLAVLLPSARLLSTSPAALLKEQSL